MSRVAPTVYLNENKGLAALYRVLDLGMKSIEAVPGWAAFLFEPTTPLLPLSRGIATRAWENMFLLEAYSPKSNSIKAAFEIHI